MLLLLFTEEFLSANITSDFFVLFEISWMTKSIEIKRNPNIKKKTDSSKFTKLSSQIQALDISFRKSTGIQINTNHFKIFDTGFQWAGAGETNKELSKQRAELSNSCHI